MKLGMLLTLALLMLVASIAWSYPTRFGPVTGLVDLPTTDTVPNGQLEMAADFAKLSDEGKVYPLRVVVGVSDSAELGIGYARLRGDGRANITSFGGKVSVMQEPGELFGLAVGGAFINNALGSDITQAYAVASKQLTGNQSQALHRSADAVPTVRGLVGMMVTRVKNGDTDSEVQPFVGLDIASPSGASFVAEYGWTKFGRDQLAAAMRFPLQDGFVVQAGVVRAPILGQDSVRFTVGFNYAFGERQEQEASF